MRLFLRRSVTTVQVIAIRLLFSQTGFSRQRPRCSSVSFPEFWNILIGKAPNGLDFIKHNTKAFRPWWPNFLIWVVWYPSLYGKISTLKLEHVQNKFLFCFGYNSQYLHHDYSLVLNILSYWRHNADLHFISFLLNGGPLYVSRLLFNIPFLVFHSISLEMVLPSISIHLLKTLPS